MTEENAKSQYNLEYFASGMVKKPASAEMCIYKQKSVKKCEQSDACLIIISFIYDTHMYIQEILIPINGSFVVTAFFLYCLRIFEKILITTISFCARMRMSTSCVK